MPIFKPCAEPGCREIVPLGQRRCGAHTRAWNLRDSRRRRAKPTSAVYQSHKWRTQTRPAILARDLRTCDCGAPATHVDHYPIPLSECEAAGIDPHDHANLRALCASCAGRADGGRSHPPVVG